MLTGPAQPAPCRFLSIKNREDTEFHESGASDRGRGRWSRWT
ncbi:hypothetical protein GbCGDNIH1_8029 [Granulibacter bethesdensis CGDNIH1]|uniref:Uncharacterized protein n=1 Tax=Granulibacter bethesdensis (strain ATCC BAA-1260 / CGDNIH1) TaxID=391165 RepID=A0A286M352_GRABC|nr:hypothetical protein GbCGDNIH5_8029 [Granulibacter bethesdensis]APH65088.1 hypothetical protein GbCGDNIH1I4_8029 [Granulibacter bethesdensis]ASV62451.1 hypothetical protein GbCGDNIH1_8029 [Granulibacter bethesdensis CGDNIH1]